MTQKEIKKWKEEVLGAVLIKAGERSFHQPSREKLNSPFKPGGVMKIFCSNCGSCYELKREGTENMFYIMGKPVPDNPSKYFYLTDSCFFCDLSGNEVGNGELREISEF